MPFQASKLDLPYKYPSSSSSSSSSPSISSLLFDHPSNSLLLSFSDSSHLLFPSFSPSSSPPPPPTPIPPSSTAVLFLRLLPSNNLLFLAASPLRTALALRAWILLANPPRFESVRLSYKKTSPAVLALPHGFGVRAAGAVNYFVVHSPAAGQIWVMGVRMEAGGFGAGLVKCAVVDCGLPIYAVGMSAGFLVLGEIGGVRVFSVRGLVKGRGKRGVRNGVGIGDSSAGFEGAAEGKGDRNLADGKVWAILSVFF